MFFAAFSIRRDRTEHVQVAGQLARRVPGAGVAPRTRKLPLRPPGQQGGPGTEGRVGQTGATVVPVEEQHPLFRDVGQGGPERRTGVPPDRQERPRPTEQHRRLVQRVPRSDQADERAEAERRRRLVRVLKNLHP